MLRADEEAQRLPNLIRGREILAISRFRLSMCWCSEASDATRPTQVEPRGFEPRTSAVQGRRSPG